MGVGRVVGLVAGGVVVALIGLVGFAATRPDELHIERSVTVAAPVGLAYEQVRDLHHFYAWSPWSKLEPDAQVEISEPSTGVGARYAWRGQQVGSGSMTTTVDEPEQRVGYHLSFVEPFPSEAEVEFRLQPAGEGVQVTWAYDQRQDLLAKAMGLVVNMDEMLGADFAKGLADLKVRTEAAAQERAAAEAAAAEAAAAEAATAAAAGAPDPAGG